MDWMMMKFARLLDGTGGAGGDGTAGQGGTGGDGGQGGQGGQGGGWKAPEGFPSEFMGANAEEALGKLWGGYGDLNKRAEGLRGELSRKPSAPASADAYTFDPGEKLKPFFGDTAKDPVFGFARAAAHKHGMSQEQFSGFISDVFGGMHEKGMIAAPYDAQSEVKSFMEMGGFDQKAATETLAANEAFAKGLSAQLPGVPEKMKPAVEAALLSLTDTAAGNFLIKSLSARLAENGIRIAGNPGGQGPMTKEDLQKMGRDPRIDPVNRDHQDATKRFDPDLRRQYDEAYKRLMS